MHNQMYLKDKSYFQKNCLSCQAKLSMTGACFCLLSLCIYFPDDEIPVTDITLPDLIMYFSL